MTCEEFSILLEEYADGALEGADAARVEGHLAACAGCADALRAIRSENAFYADYAARTEPSGPSWESVRRAIAADRPAAAPPRPTFLERLSARMAGALSPGPALAAAAAILLAVGAGFVLLRGDDEGQIAAVKEPVAHAVQHGGADPQDLGQNPEGPDGEAAPPLQTQDRVKHPAKRPARHQKPRAPKGPATTRGEFPAGLARTSRPGTPSLEPAAQTDPDAVAATVAIAQAESVYGVAIEHLSREYDARKRGLGADASRKLDSTIAELDKAIAGTRRAVAQNPNDPEALQSLLSVYAQKIEVLQEVASR